MTPENIVCVIGGELVVRGSLEGLLRPVGIDVVQYGTVSAFLRDPQRLSFSCIVLNLSVIDESILEFLGQFRERGVAVIVATQQADVGSALKALKAGAIDFLEAPVDGEVLLAAINGALARRGQFDLERQTSFAKRKIASLSPREHLVLEELMAGRITKQIAFRMGISVRTVEVHRARMLQRLGVRSLAEALILAVTALIGPDNGRDDRP
jgi:two-component system, LuxR family, response regulator FixJ